MLKKPFKRKEPSITGTTQVNDSLYRDTHLKLIEEAQRLAQAIERGHADAPLSLLLHRLQQAISTRNLRAVWLGFDAAAEDDALAWLTGREFVPVLNRLRQRSESLTLKLGEPELALEANGRYRSFDSMASLMQELEQLGKVSTTILSLPGAQAMAALELVVLPKSNYSAKDGAGLSRLALDNHLLIVAAPLDYSFNEPEKALLSSADAAFQAVWPLLIQTPGVFSMPDVKWWSQLLKPKNRMAERLVCPDAPPTSQSSQLPAFLVDENNGGRQHLNIMRDAARLYDASVLLQEQQQQRQRQLATRKERDGRQLRQLEQEVQQQGTQRQQWNELRQMLQDGLPDVLRDLIDSRRKQKSSTGQLAAQVTQLVSCMQETDLRQEASQTTIRLTIHPGFTGRLLGLLRESVNDEIHGYAEELTTRVANLRLILQQQARVLAPDIKLAAVNLDARAVAAVLVDMIGLELRYKGEVPKRNFLDRFKEGRQGAMGFMMLASMGAMVFGGNLREESWFGPLIGIIFVSSMAYTVVSWRQEDKERLERELDRVREGVQSELNRLMGELQREMQSRFNDQVERLKKQWLKEIESASEEKNRQRQDNLESERSQQRDRQRATEAQKQDVDSLSSPLQKLLRDAELFVKSLEQ